MDGFKPIPTSPRLFCIAYTGDKSPAYRPKSFYSPSTFTRLVEAEVDGDGDQDRNGGLAILERGLELVLPNRLKRLFVESHAERANHARVDGISLCIDDESDHDLAL